MKRAIELALSAIPIAIVGAVSHYFGVSTNLCIVLMVLSAIVICVIVEVRK